MRKRSKVWHLCRAVAHPARLSGRGCRTWIAEMPHFAKLAKSPAGHTTGRERRSNMRRILSTARKE